MSVRLLIKIAIPVALAALLMLAGCAPKDTVPAATSPTQSAVTSAASNGVSSGDGARYKPVWITPEVNGEQLSISLSAVEESRMAHFWANTTSGKESFMAYKLDGVTYVRANACPPCRSYNFSLEKGVLVCETCATKFEARTGKGISGACVNYPKSAVQFELKDGNLTMTMTDLVASYAETLKAG